MRNQKKTPTPKTKVGKNQTFHMNNGKQGEQLLKVLGGHSETLFM